MTSITKKGRFGKRTVQLGKRGRCVNAQAFSFLLDLLSGDCNLS